MSRQPTSHRRRSQNRSGPRGTESLKGKGIQSMPRHRPSAASSWIPDSVNGCLSRALERDRSHVVLLGVRDPGPPFTRQHLHGLWWVRDHRQPQHGAVADRMPGRSHAGSIGHGLAGLQVPHPPGEGPGAHVEPDAVPGTEAAAHGAQVHGDALLPRAADAREALAEVHRLPAGRHDAQPADEVRRGGADLRAELQRDAPCNEEVLL
mmetsp:Transcript_24926/g.68464  ORF Transcript_24926/g.68464 Transcript_24926/m.68464 type:complete len:207 (-) Transcript_24926:1582-2202(-)